MKNRLKNWKANATRETGVVGGGPVQEKEKKGMNKETLALEWSEDDDMEDAGGWICSKLATWYQ